MKKILTVLLIVSLMMSFTVSTVFAEEHGSKLFNFPFTKMTKSENGQLASPSVFPFKKMDTIIKKYKEQMKLRKADFEEIRLTVKELRKQTKEELATQRQEVRSYMEQLHSMAQDFKSMTKEQRIEAKDDMKALIQQVRDAHKYKLQIVFTTKAKIRKLFSEVLHNGLPSEDTINSTAPILDEL